MMQEIKATEFRTKVIELSNGKDRNTIFEYLRTTGMVVTGRNGTVTIDSKCLEKVKFFASTVEEGDVIWNKTHGMLLIVDKHPSTNNDGKHYRALKVEPCFDGSFKIIGSERSVVIDDAESFRVRHTSFDIQKIKELSNERYLAYTKIAQINNTLNEMKENPNV